MIVPGVATLNLLCKVEVCCLLTLLEPQSTLGRAQSRFDSFDEKAALRDSADGALADATPRCMPAPPTAHALPPKPAETWSSLASMIRSKNNSMCCKPRPSPRDQQKGEPLSENLGQAGIRSRTPMSRSTRGTRGHLANCLVVPRTTRYPSLAPACATLFASVSHKNAWPQGAGRRTHGVRPSQALAVTRPQHNRDKVHPRAQAAALAVIGTRARACGRVHANMIQYAGARPDTLTHYA